jgi:hypothetical protein
MLYPQQGRVPGNAEKNNRVFSLNQDVRQEYEPCLSQSSSVQSESRMFARAFFLGARGFDGNIPD